MAQDKLDTLDKENWICDEENKNIGGWHLFPQAEFTGFYTSTDGQREIVVKRDPRKDRNIMEVFAANFMKGLMEKLYQSGNLIANTGFINPPTNHKDKKPYIYSERFKGNILYQDVVAALAVKDEQEGNAFFGNAPIVVPDGPWLPSDELNHWLEKKPERDNPERYNKDYLRLVAASLFLGDPDIHSGNFFVVKDETHVQDPALRTFNVANKKDKEFEVYEKVRVTRFDFGGIRGLTPNTIMNSTEGVLHYVPFTGPPFHFATFSSAVKDNPALYVTLAQISLLTTDDLKDLIKPAVLHLRHCSIEDLSEFIKAQNLPVQIDPNDDVNAYLKKIEKAFLIIYTDRKISCRYQTLEYLLSLPEKRKRDDFINDYGLQSFLNDTSDESIKKAMRQDENNYYSEKMDFKRQYRIYKHVLYKEEKRKEISLDNKKLVTNGPEEKDVNVMENVKISSVLEKINSKIDKYSKGKFTNDPIAKDFVTKLQELQAAFNISNADEGKIDYRYHLAKYIYERRKLAEYEGGFYTFCRKVAGLSMETKISAAEKIDRALETGEKVHFESEEYAAIREGNLSDINTKFFPEIYSKLKITYSEETLAYRY